MTWVTPNQPSSDEDHQPQQPQPVPPPVQNAPPGATATYPQTVELPPPPVGQDAPPPRRRAAVSTGRRLVGLGVLLLAAAMTLIALAVIFWPLLSEPTVENIPPAETIIAVQPTATAADEEASGTDTPPDSAPAVIDPGVSALPTLSPEEAAALLATPPGAAGGMGSAAIQREDDPFTIIPERPRNEIIAYEVQSGDTVTTIAEQFGLEMDSVGWCNDRATIFALRPGAELLIPPVDGVCHQVLVPETFEEIAARYSIEDPYAIINSEFNDFFGMSPGSELQSGQVVFVPGGVSSYIDWQYNPVVERSGGGGGESGGGFISFASGEPGSCGRQENPGHAGFGSTPLTSYSWSRGFSSFHTGVDLAADPGTTVYAAASGRVIYAGWNNWGYGNLVVVAHGPFTTFYAHLSGYNVGCGQYVNAGSAIASVGSTGQSSGPHLHFEIRYNDIPTDPLLYYSF